MPTPCAQKVQCVQCSIHIFGAYTNGVPTPACPVPQCCSSSSSIQQQQRMPRASASGAKFALLHFFTVNNAAPAGTMTGGKKYLHVAHTW